MDGLEMIDTSTLTTDSETGSDGATFFEEMEEFDLEEMMIIEEKVEESIKRKSTVPGDDNAAEDASAAASGEVTVASKREEAFWEEKKELSEECRLQCEKIVELESQAINSPNPLVRKRAKKMIALGKKKARATKAWLYLAIRYKVTVMARAGELAKLKRFFDMMDGKPGAYMAEVVKNILPNVVRAACRRNDQQMVDYMILKRGVDVNALNSVGMPLIYFSILGNSAANMGLFIHMKEELGGDPTIKSHMGQNLLFYIIVEGSTDRVKPKLDYCVNELGLDPRTVDKYGCSLLHWCVLHQNMDAAQYIYDKGWEVHSRAKWRSLLELLEQINFIPDDVKQASSEWRSRGLLKYANDASPLGVAILHNNGRFAKMLMGLGSHNCICTKRKNLFEDNCRDLEMVAKAWPELLPDVLESFGEVEDPSQAAHSNTLLPKASKPDPLGAPQVYGNPNNWSQRAGNAAKGSGSGYTKTSYSIRDILGDSDTPVTKTPLAILTKTESPEVFDAPIVRLVINLKWNTFGRRSYMEQFVPYLVCLISSWVGFSYAGGLWCRVVAYAMCIYLLCWEEIREMYREGLFEYLLSPWNYFSCPAYVAILYSGVCQDILEAEQSSELALIKALATFALILRALEFMSILSSTSLFVVTVRMLVQDIILWGVLFVFFIVAFSATFFTLLEGEENFETLMGTGVTVFRMSIGDFDYPFSEDRYRGNAATVLWVLYTFIVNLLYLNVLIAMMSKSFEKVEDAASGMSSLALAKSLVTWEATLSSSCRRKYHEKIIPTNNDKRAVKLVITEGLGNWWHFMFGWLHVGFGAVASQGKPVTIDNGTCTVFEKVEKDWKQMEEEDRVEREEQKKQEMDNMKTMLMNMSTGMGEMKAMMMDGKNEQENKEEEREEGGIW
jgi:hypothetical protein